MPALSIRGVTKSFRSERGTTYTAIRDLSFDAQPGQFVAVVGPSGCGKSTVLGLASGLQLSDRGDVHTFGARLEGLNPHTSYMFQQDALLPWKTILDNVTLGLSIRGIRRAAARETGMHWLARVGLTSFAHHFPHQLSGGMRRRAAIAQTWIVDPDILLMDEPFSALDVQNRQIMGAELLSLWQGSDKCVIFVTHDLEEAIGLADRVIVMSAGPASTLVGDYTIDLPRPRNVMDIRLDPSFVELYKAIWGDLRREVLKSQANVPGISA